MHVFRTLLAQYSVESSPLVSADWGKSDMGEGVLEETALGDAWPAARVGWYATILLTLANPFSFVDRQVLNLLVEPIKQELSLSDTSISFLQGLAFVAE